ncbi:hypothetical protein Y032_0036g3250 [Ancylostoma ceylanicum]|uniref:Paired domain-containing protein n=1 Tax=Ancylostoma ceylanicum TaxID=53326 RepID=A0A016UL46_9BILA|nr:hypothetical protein Y032_0036g3250 [Ancylostoma ceylanicum]
MEPSPHPTATAALTDNGMQPVEIARRLGISASTVRKIVRQYRERGHVVPLQNPGRPRSTRHSAVISSGSGSLGTTPSASTKLLTITITIVYSLSHSHK